MPDKEYEFKFVPSMIEDVDFAMTNYIDKDLNLHTVTNDGMKKVPVIWLGSERAFQVKNNRDIRDSAGKLKFPLITVSRASLEKDKTFKGAIQAHLEPPRDNVLPVLGTRFFLRHIVAENSTTLSFHLARRYFPLVGMSQTPSLQPTL